MKATRSLALLLLVSCSTPSTPAGILGDSLSEAALRALETALLERLAEQRAAAGVGELDSHPALQRDADERASLLAARERLASTPAEITATTDRLWRLGYGPHFWREAVIAGDLDAASLSRSRFDSELMRPDLEHAVTACRSRPNGQALCLLIVAERRLTKELRDTEPLQDLARVRTAVLGEVNRHRLAEGRRPLEEHADLDRAAQGHAEAMLQQGFYDHQAPDGSTPRQRADAAGYNAREIAENIAKASVPPTEIVAQWMASSGHRRNVLLQRAVHHGLGVAIGVREGNVEVLWCELFASP